MFRSFGALFPLWRSVVAPSLDRNDKVLRGHKKSCTFPCGGWWWRHLLAKPTRYREGEGHKKKFNFVSCTDKGMFKK